MTPILELHGVDVLLGGRRVLDHVSLSVGEGEFTGLIGTNGAGKTTLIKVALGLLEPRSGQVLVGGLPRGAGSRLRSGLEQTVGYVPQKIDLDPDMPLRARDLVRLGIDGHRLGFGRRSAERSRRVEEALDAVGATSFADSRVGRLSGGEQQRVMIAHALVSRPRLLLLDEPLANLDIASVESIVSVLAELSRRRRMAVIVSAHDVNPLLPVMDRIVYMAGGRAASGTTDEVVRSEVLTELYRVPVEVLRVQGRVLVLAAGNLEPESHAEHPDTPRGSVA